MERQTVSGGKSGFPILVFLFVLVLPLLLVLVLEEMDDEDEKEKEENEETLSPTRRFGRQPIPAP